MRAAILAAGAALALAGCLGDPGTRCGVGFCAAGKVCDTIHNGCVEPEQLSSCAGQADEADCTAPGIADGACFDGVCFPRGCGNGFIEDGEVCDDGNNLFGDGCSADCVSDETCGNGVIDDAQGEACDPADDESDVPCRSDCTVKTCGDGIRDEDFNEICDDGDANSNEPDAACRTNCQPQRCGDGIEDAGEVCDDGNVFVDDGCTPDCTSDETCGNGVLDFHRDELCDDASPLLSHDGCGGQCLPGAGSWLERTPALPGALTGHAVAYDAARGRLVMFGGDAETWEWDGTSWTEVTPATESPSPRTEHAMAYDASRARVVLFGGETDGVEQNDTWEWDGQSWLEVTPLADNPPARFGHAMAYDSARDQLILFGGSELDGLFSFPKSDTWAWDGSAWAEIDVTGPPARQDHRMVFDSRRGQVVLFGGTDVNPLQPSQNDTWIWDGQAWSEAQVAGPPVRDDHVMVYDAALDRVVVFGGQTFLSGGGTVTYDDTWVWDGASWNELSTGGDTPGARAGSAAGFDLGNSEMVLFGGASTADTFTLSGATYNLEPVAADHPTARTEAAVAYDAARGRLVLFGGVDDVGLSSETWEWDGASWEQITPAGDIPPARRAHAMAYDAARQQVVLFGGVDDAPSTLDDTWIWDGASWTPATPAESPPPLADHAMVYDAARSEIVLFGGATTATWDGDSWAVLAPADTPPTRSRHALAYDAIRDRAVLFGGLFRKKDKTNLLFDDTWEWDGTNWTDVSPDGRTPVKRSSHQLAYDATRRAVMLSGPDTWEWNGTGWSEVTSENPPARGGHAMAYDAARGQSIAVGGSDGNASLAETWALRYQRAGDPGEACEVGAFDYDGDGAVGCDDPDCWGRCLPECPPDSTPDWPDDCDDALPHCGDGVCNPALESQRLCPGDCGDPPEICGDFICEGAEDETTCPGDCSP